MKATSRWIAGGVLTAAVVGWIPPAVAASSPAANEWDKTVAAAKREGKVAMIAPTGADIRAGFTQGFQKKYPEIQVEYNGIGGAQVSPKLLTEQAAGHFSTDLVIAGTSTILEALIPANAVVPIQPFLTGPDSRDLSKWRGAKQNFSDSAGKFNLVFGERVQVAFIYNPELVPANKIRSWKDLLNTEWKGKIAMINPRRAGAGLDISTFWFASEAAGLGKPYMREFFTSQELFISNDERQLVDSVARGKYSVAIGPSGTLAFEFRNKGLPIELFGSAALREGGFVVASNGTVVVLKNAPHPNAAKLYLDYLLSREGQINWSKASGLTSLRLDVPRDHIPEVLVPKDGVKYLEVYREQHVSLREQMIAYLNSILTR
jgi:iron(III) transport system substrate-binding protein